MITFAIIAGLYFCDEMKHNQLPELLWFPAFTLTSVKINLMFLFQTFIIFRYYLMKNISNFSSIYKKKPYKNTSN